MDNSNLWELILEQLRKNINDKSFNTWFNGTKFLELKNEEEICILVSSEFAKNFLSKNYKKILTEIAYNLFNKNYQITFIAPSKKQIKEEREIFHKNIDKDIYVKTITHKLVSSYSFENFVVGKTNNFAYSSALSVANHPGTKYNPLFIFGDAGTGKTHLLHAIGNHYKTIKENAKIQYITSEEFTNEMIKHIYLGKMEEFRNKFRKLDILLVDDIQFISKKDSTQEEFFHTFNTLKESKKQIVITSDKLPSEIIGLEKRLISRFESGLVSDIKPPDFETRAAIIKLILEKNNNIFIKDSLIQYIASKTSESVRNVQGAVTKVIAYLSYENINPEDLSLLDIEKILDNISNNKIKDINMDIIFESICEEYKITKTNILSKSRKKIFAFPRQIAMYISNLLIPQLSLMEIAKYYKKKDHTTVIHALKTIEENMKNDETFKVSIENLIKKIKNQ